MLTRSRHSQAHKKLGDLHRRWLEANRLLAPTVEFLPQLLVVPVVLFVVGLLDNVISSAVPASSPFIQVFVAGILPSVFDTAVAMYTVWTVLHGWLYPDYSPFQSSLMHFWFMYGPSVIDVTEQVLLKIPMSCRSWISWLTRSSAWSRNTTLAAPSSSSDSAAVVNAAAQQTDPTPKSVPLALHDAEAFHAALKVTHDDIITDQALAAFPTLMMQCLSQFRVPAPMQDKSYHVARLLDHEIDSCVYMLSSEASARANVSAATFIADPFSFAPGALPG